ncbi:hypothetical protein [Clostridium sp. 1001275B_160808_H3]|uniref:hypothetical protein n=1 Tax=Clostridium sp. 1001275B_160808_H3 TaxID=2787110 RepID=UPI001899385B|nr:hypothetical protein [Clostridium sp. 1001275B_160808_H3]
MKSLLKILAFIPLGIELLLLLVIHSKVAGMIWMIHIPITILLGIVGMGIVSKKKFIQRSGFGALIVLTVLLCIIGYYDYVKWFSSIVGMVIFMYYVIISILMKKTKNSIRLNE